MGIKDKSIQDYKNSDQLKQDLINEFGTIKSLSRRLKTSYWVLIKELNSGEKDKMNDILLKAQDNIGADDPTLLSDEEKNQIKYRISQKNQTQAEFAEVNGFDKSWLSRAITTEKYGYRRKTDNIIRLMNLLNIY